MMRVRGGVGRGRWVSCHAGLAREKNGCRNRHVLCAALLRQELCIRERVYVYLARGGGVWGEDEAG